jgi:hypothetical protein
MQMQQRVLGCGGRADYGPIPRDADIWKKLDAELELGFGLLGWFLGMLFLYFIIAIMEWKSLIKLLLMLTFLLLYFAWLIYGKSKI